MNGTGEFKCECRDGFDGKRCDEVCSLFCAKDEFCTTQINDDNIKTWICEPVLPDCNGNRCCTDSRETAICCENGVCSNPNFIFNETNADECKCVCTDNYAGLT